MDAIEWKAVQVGPSWGVESKCGDRPSQLMVVGLSEGRAKQMARECRESQLAEAREEFVASGGSMGGEDY